jgi:dihydroflavonol-4-reductase
MKNNKNSHKILVTGASGYLGVHCLVELLKAGYFVRGTLRNLSDESMLREIIEKEIDITNNLEFCELDITEDQHWESVMKDCYYVLAIATPSSTLKYSQPDELISITQSSILKLLKTAKEVGIKRVTLISSQVTVTYGHDNKNKIYNESDWTNLNSPSLDQYIRSRTISEKMAWQFINSQENKTLELCTIHPGFIVGPLLHNEIRGISAKKFKSIFTKRIFLFPNRYVNYVDVRDIAKLQVAAIKSDLVSGKRLLCISSNPISFNEISSILKKEGYRFFIFVIPDFLIKFLGLFSKRFKQMSYLLNRKMIVDNSETKDLLDWKQTPIEVSIRDMANSITKILNLEK